LKVGSKKKAKKEEKEKPTPLAGHS